MAPPAWRPLGHRPDLAFLNHFDEALPLEDLGMVAHLAVGHPQVLGEVLGGARLVLKGVEDAGAHRVPDGGELPGAGQEEGAGRRMYRHPVT